MRPVVELTSNWRYPSPEIRQLSKGLSAWIFDLPGQHIAAFEFIMPAPLWLEPTRLEGVAQIAVNASDEGTLDNPDGRIAELLELQGSALHGTAGHWYSRLGGDVPTSRLQATTPLLAEILTHPQYAEADVAHHVALQLAAHDSRAASPSAVARRALREALHGLDSRRGRPPGGSPDTLRAITPHDVHAWHEDHLLRSGGTLVLAGHLQGLDVDGILAPLAEAWPSEAIPATEEDHEALPPRLVVVDMPSAVQATVQLACPTPGRRNPDWAAMKVAGHVLAGGFASRLNLELRERRGLTYGIQGGFSAQPNGAQFSVQGSFRTEVAAEAVSHIREAIALDVPFTAQEINDATRFLVGIAPLANETASAIARQAFVLAAAGEGPEFVNEHFTALERVTPEEATAALRRHVHPSGVTIAISGPATRLEPMLRAAGLDPTVVSPPAPSTPAP